jgi:C-terminal processing protease CtpA/Prc
MAASNEMDRKTKIAVAVIAVLLLAAGVVIYFHQPPKPVRVQRQPRVTEFAGVGIALRMDAQSSGPIIQQVIPNSPAAAAHINAGMTISKVNDISLEGKTLAECANLIRGPVGTTVTLELVTPDGSRTNTVELTRQKLKL